jgi:GAF domain-containing protein/HAMP domain-containing protein
MSAQRLTKKSKRSTSLAATLATAFVVLAIISLLLVSGFQLMLNFWTQQAVVAGEQQIIALDAAQQVSGFVENIFSTLESAMKVSSPFSGSVEEQELLLQKLLGLEPALRGMTLLDNKGQEAAQVSRLSVVASADLTNQAGSELFSQASQGQRYISSVHNDETTGEPLVTVAIPIKNIFGDFEGVLVAEVNLKFMWDVVGSLQVGETGLAYVVDKQGNLIAFGDTSRVLRGENLSHLAEVGEFVNREDQLLELEEESQFISTGINGANVLATYSPLGTPDWAVVIELPVTEAYQTLAFNLALSVGVLLGVAFLAGIAGVYVARRLAAPLHNLTVTATRIAEGEVELTAPIEGPTEVTLLAGAFNSMTAQLRELISSLEQRIAARTRRLEIAATLGERMSAVLNVEQLLTEVVNQIKDSFGYYHTHIYLLDDKREKLVVAEGTGEAGAEMKARGHNIPLDAPTSLVARAARTSEIVTVDNVQTAADWLPNPLLPNTHAEMAVPIILAGQVVGVLDVQSDQIAGLDAGDANLLRSLTSQVAVALRNARQFVEVETALAEARETQRRYLEQAWEQSKMTQQHLAYHYHRPGVLPLSEAVTVQLERQILVQNQPTIVEVNGPDDNRRSTKAEAGAENLAPHHPEVILETQTPASQSQTALIAPIRLQNQTIGTIQLYETERPRHWSERDLALVEVVTEQMAQSAENLRLFEETRERAAREQTIREITERMRAATSLEELVKTTAHELGERLSAGRAKVELGFEPETHSSTSLSNRPDNGR